MFRAYYALPPMHGPDGTPTNCLFGVHRMLTRLLDDLAPTHGAACFDLPEPTFRHEAFAAYKAHRGEAPDDFVQQIEPSKELFAAYGFFLVEAPGFEADDVIATLAAKAQEEAEVLILSPDRDLIQLVSENVSLLLPERGVSSLRKLGPREVQATYGVSPSQWVDYKVLVGDPSDNIPGVPGIGPKTAAKLLSRYGTLPAALEHVAELPEKLQVGLKGLLEQREAKERLMALRCDVGLAVSLEALLLRPDEGRRNRFFSRFGIVAGTASAGSPKAPVVQSSLF